LIEHPKSVFFRSKIGLFLNTKAQRGKAGKQQKTSTIQHPMAALCRDAATATQKEISAQAARSAE